MRARSVITTTHRLTIYDQPGWVELYDLQKDPHELVNLIDDPTYAQVRAHMFEILARELMMADDRSPFPFGACLSAYFFTTGDNNDFFFFIFPPTSA